MEDNRLIFEQGPLTGQEVFFPDRPIVFGRGNTADILIPNSNVSRQHARLTPEGGSYRLEDLGSLNGTFINEVRLAQPQLLANGDRVRLGTEVVLRVVLIPKDEGTVIVGGFQSPGATQVVKPVPAPMPVAEPEPPPQTVVLSQTPVTSDATMVMRPAGAAPLPMEPAVPARLLVSLPDGQQSEYALIEPQVSVGRLADNDIALNVATISRRQLKLVQQGEQYRLDVEPNSVNPVFVNGERVSGQRLLEDGDELCLGYIGGDTSVVARYQAYRPAQAPAQPSAAAAGATQPPPPAPQPRATTTTPPAARTTPPPAQDVGNMTVARTGPLPAARTPAGPPRDAGATFIGALPAAAVTEPPQLVVTAYGREPAVYTLDEIRTRIGRSADNDIVIENRFVSRYHAEIERRVTGYYVVPSANLSNPLVLDGAPVMEATRLSHGAKVRLGGYDPGDMVTMVYLAPGDEPINMGQTVQFSESKVVSIGRAAENDIVLPAPVVSRFHAQVERIGQRYRVRDLGSGNGTFVNGNAVRGDTWVQVGDAIHVGPYRLQVGDEIITQTDESQGGMRVEAQDLNKRVRKDLNVLQNISLAFLPREFIVVVGQSGGGKSTLVDAIAGYRPATHGKVIVNDTIDVYKDFDAIRNTIGYVPQKDIIHMELTVFQALDYAAQLRMPADTTTEERHQRIAEVMEELDLTHRRDTQISELSGGQQKRVSIGVELLTKPGLFFLDEPTSGLDPGTETELMQLMRRLADQGRTIVLITHATKNVMLADRVVFLARGGYLAWFGPPEEALTYFDQFRSERQRRTKPIEFDDIYNLLDHEELGVGKDWAERYRKHEAYQKYIARPLGEDRPKTKAAAAPAAATRNKRRPVSALRQFMILSTRSLNILVRDRATLGLMLLSAPLMAALDFVLAFGVGRNPFGFEGGDFNNVIVTLIVLTNTSILVGGLVMMRELVKEREIYKRERMVNLRLSSYIFSKLWFALLLAVYQSFWFTLIRHLAFDMPGGWAEVFYFFITVFLMVLAGMMMGLFTSAISPNANAAPLILVMFILPQIVLSGALVPLPSFASAVASSRWAFQAAIAIGGAGSDVAGDTCWVDKTAAERDDMTRDEKDSECDCLGANALREASCNFPGLAEFYDAAVDAPDPVEPAEPGDQPEPPVFPDQPESPVFPDQPESPVFPDPPEQPEDMSNPLVVQQYLADLEAYNTEVTTIREDYEAELDAYNEEATALQDEFEAELDDYQAETDEYKDAIEVYQDDLTEVETDRATAIGSAEASIERFYEDYGWTFVDKDDQQNYLRVLLTTWLAQGIIITVLFLGTVIAQKSRDVR